MCRCCRVCFEWGSRTPGGGASSRWLPAAGQGPRQYPRLSPLQRAQSAPNQIAAGRVGKRKPKLQLQPPPALDKNDGVLAAIESAVAGSNLDNSFDDVKLEPLVTNEQDVVELRNLQKLGIGD
ncbi:uncharacterized protein LOC120424734 [Culex pipiens pallens]|uniref:uncharacterized protein LOC120424734 n=1 Tax=Culex pipiens pallens TaxID=42434 RepID=UPI001952DE1E|nr:uncharacterized protein LOC120424734 [Culex pipiens pallens]